MVKPHQRHRQTLGLRNEHLVGWDFYEVIIFPQESLVGLFVLKAVDTIGNCQRLAFTVSVSQHMHKITNL